MSASSIKSESSQETHRHRYLLRTRPNQEENPFLSRYESICPKLDQHLFEKKFTKEKYKFVFNITNHSESLMGTMYQKFCRSVLLKTANATIGRGAYWEYQREKKKEIVRYSVIVGVFGTRRDIPLYVVMDILASNGYMEDRVTESLIDNVVVINSYWK